VICFAQKSQLIRIWLQPWHLTSCFSILVTAGGAAPMDGEWVGASARNIELTLDVGWPIVGGAYTIV
jgi:hypothetical protein